MAGDRELDSGSIRLRILHHAARDLIFGLRIVEELARHGDDLSSGMLSPMLTGLERS